MQKNRFRKVDSIFEISSLKMESQFSVFTLEISWKYYIFLKRQMDGMIVLSSKMKINGLNDDDIYIKLGITNVLLFSFSQIRQGRMWIQILQFYNFKVIFIFNSDAIYLMGKWRVWQSRSFPMVSISIISLYLKFMSLLIKFKRGHCIPDTWIVEQFSNLIQYHTSQAKITGAGEPGIAWVKDILDTGS